MIALAINGINLDLTPDVELPLNVRFNLFTDGQPANGSRLEYTINVPATEKNRAALSHPERLHNANKPTNGYNGYLYFNTNLQAPCYIKVVSANSKSYEIMILLGSGSFYSQFKDKPLRSFDFGKFNLWDVEGTYEDITIGPGGILEGGYTPPTSPYYPYSPDVSPFALFAVKVPYFNTGYDESIIPSVSAKMWQNFFDPQYFSPPTPLPAPPMAITPFYYVAWIIEKIFENTGYKIAYSVFRTNSELEKLCLYNLCDVRPNTDTNTQERWSYVNQHLPKCTVGQLFKELEVNFAIKFQFDVVNNNVSIIQLNERLNAIPIDIRSFDGQELSYSDYDSVLNPAYFNFKRSVNKEDKANVLFDYIDSERSTKQKITGVVSTYSNLPTNAAIGNIYFVTDINRYYIRRLANTPAGIANVWELFYSYFSELNENENATNIISEAITLPMASEYLFYRDFSVQQKIYAPVCYLQGFESDNFNPDTTEMPICFMFWRGRLTTPPIYDYSYDFGSSDVFQDDQGSRYPNAKYSLVWQQPAYDDNGFIEDTGLIANFYSEYLSWRRKSIKVTFTAIITPEQLISLQKALIWRTAQTLVLPEEIQATITNKRQFIARFTGWVL